MFPTKCPLESAKKGRIADVPRLSGKIDVSKFAIAESNETKPFIPICRRRKTRKFTIFYRNKTDQNFAKALKAHLKDNFCKFDKTKAQLGGGRRRWIRILKIKGGNNLNKPANYHIL